MRYKFQEFTLKKCNKNSHEDLKLDTIHKGIPLTGRSNTVFDHAESPFVLVGSIS